ncbi:MAG: hypothetical protein FJX72_21450, partial [Armatimonadetes bacterium]|nr:hypothetical protein [Armatimonadota bacterium]
MTAVELVLALHATRGVGDSAIEAVLRGAAIARLTPDDVCRLEPRDLRSRFGLPEAQAMKIAEGLRVHGADAREMSRRLRALDVAVLAVTDAAYPERLTE